MMINKLVVALSAVSLLLAVPAMADHRQGRGDHDYFYDKARVVNAEPVYEIVRTPVENRECWREEYTRQRRADSGASMVVGSIIGGVIGHQVGDGDGRKVATVAGTIIGAAVGREMGRQNEGGAEVVSERRCRVSEDYVEERVLTGYDVTYRYGGRIYSTFMEEDPGKFIEVQVGVAPVGY